MNLVEKWLYNHLGEQRKTNNPSEVIYKCPFCTDDKYKFYISLTKGVCHCFKCGASTSLLKLISNVEHKPKSVIKQMFGDLALEQENVATLSGLSTSFEEVFLDTSLENVEKRCVPLPDENGEKYTLLNPNKAETKTEQKALEYLYSRGITPTQIIENKFKLARNGVYNNRIIIPIVDEHKQKFYVARSINKTTRLKEVSPHTNWWNYSKSEVLFGLDNALKNGLGSIVLCEGIFDALAWRMNGVSMLGKSLYKSQLARLFQVSDSIKRIYICLDFDAQEDVVKLAEQLKPVYKDKLYIVQIPKEDDDPNNYVCTHGLISLYRLLETAIPYQETYSLSFKVENAIIKSVVPKTANIVPNKFSSIKQLEIDMQEMF